MSALATAEIRPALTSVVVVIADSGMLAVDCVARVLASNAMVEVLVVDNASQDGVLAELAERFGQDSRLSILPQAVNMGFGPACNRGAMRARGDGLLFLNPDCLLDPGTIARLRATADTLDDVGVLGVRVLDCQGVEERATRRRDPVLSRALSTLLGLARLENRWPALAGIRLPTADAAATAERVDAVSGAFLYLPRTAFESVGGFDEAYFLHCEDLDLCRRIRDAGLEVIYLPAISVRHEQGSSSRRRPLFVSRHKHRGMWRYFKRFDPAARNTVVRVLVWSGIWMHFLLLAPGNAWRQYRSRVS